MNFRTRGLGVESGREDQAVERMLDTVDHDAAFGDAVHAEAVGVDQSHVGAVERCQVVVVEARPLAEVAVPRFERLGGVRIGHDRVDTINLPGGPVADWQARVAPSASGWQPGGS